MTTRKGYHLARNVKPLIDLVDEYKLARVPGVAVEDASVYKADIEKMIEALDNGKFPGLYGAAYALAHHQIARLHARFFVVRTDISIKYFDDHQVFLNPIVKLLGNPVAKREPCMSHAYRDPRKVTRWPAIIAEWNDYETGERKSATLHGLAAQIFQHETDHTFGKTVWLDKIPA